jgi:hypothetical protein
MGCGHSTYITEFRFPLIWVNFYEVQGNLICSEYQLQTMPNAGYSIEFYEWRYKVNQGTCQSIGYTTYKGTSYYDDIPVKQWVKPEPKGPTYTKCPNGMFSDNGASGCFTKCPGGLYSTDGQTGCTKLEAKAKVVI